MCEDNDLVWLIERSYEAYLTWLVLWLACMIALVTILVGTISVPFTLSLNHLGLIWLLYWGLVSGMIFSVYRLVNIVGDQVSWLLRATENKKRPTLRKDAVDKRGRLSHFFVRVRNENTEMERAEICQPLRILTYLIHVAVAGSFFWLAVGNLFYVFVTASIIFVVASFLTYHYVDP
jgi:membrane protein implicated in regulation of membrane protease activity